MSIRAILAFALFIAASGTVAATTGDPPGSTARLLETYEAKTRLFRPCPQGGPGEVVVCARNREDEQARNRLPLPVEQPADSANRYAGEIPRASSAPVRKGSCGTVRGDPPICNQGLTIVKTRF